MTCLALGMARAATNEDIGVVLLFVSVAFMLNLIFFIIEGREHNDILRELRKLNPPPTEAWERDNAILRGKLKESDRREERGR